MPLSLISKLVVPDWISFLRSCNSIDSIFLSSFVISGFMEIPGLLASFAREDNIEVMSHDLLSLTRIGLCFVSEYFPAFGSRVFGVHGPCYLVKLEHQQLYPCHSSSVHVWASP